MRNSIRREKHHWWPKSLSKFWANKDELVNRIDSNGKNITSKPKEFGQISNGHNIIFDDKESTLFTVEHIFDTADRNMPTIVYWLENLNSIYGDNNSDFEDTIKNEKIDEILDILRECIISLVIRSPRYRSLKQSISKHFRGKLDKRENMGLVSFNINQSYLTLVNSSKGCGKIVVLVSNSNEYEFIYGDGTYSNIGAWTDDLYMLKLVIPMTPSIAIVWSSPTAYRTEPKIAYKKADKYIVELVNNSTQAYSKDYIFYRTKKPDLTSEFTVGKHGKYEPKEDSMAKFIDALISDENSFLSSR